jgi:hypothetical protein
MLTADRFQMEANVPDGKQLEDFWRGIFRVRRGFIHMQALQKSAVILLVAMDVLQKLFHLGIGEERIQILFNIGEELAQHDRFLNRRWWSRRRLNFFRLGGGRDYFLLIFLIQNFPSLLIK